MTPELDSKYRALAKQISTQNLTDVAKIEQLKRSLGIPQEYIAPSQSRGEDTIADDTEIARLQNEVQQLTSKNNP